VVPFHLRYTLSRRQRLAVEVYPWLPAVAGSLGFISGIVFLSIAVSRWFLPWLLLPSLVYRGFFVFFAEIVFRAGRPVEVVVDADRYEVLTCGRRQSHSLEGIIQVFRSEEGTSWTVLHMDGSVLTIPAEAITAEQLDYLKSFARRAAEERRATAADG
jgi:hypothetical protein